MREPSGRLGPKKKPRRANVEAFENIIKFPDRRTDVANATATAINTQEEGLRNTINTIDSLSHEGFSVISAIANLALRAMESPDLYTLHEDLANALIAIRSKAGDIQNCINAEAETVGCNYVDEGMRSRLRAKLARGRAGA